MQKTIPLDPKFEFSFLEDKNIQFEHPISNYYFKVNDLSINTVISFKWIFWGFYFFKSISTEIVKPEFAVEFVLNKEILKQWDLSKKINHTLLFNDVIVNSETELTKLIETDYDLTIFDENTKVHIKLKLNLDEYILLTNVYFPTLICFD